MIINLYLSTFNLCIDFFYRFRYASFIPISNVSGSHGPACIINSLINKKITITFMKTKCTYIKSEKWSWYRKKEKFRFSSAKNYIISKVTLNHSYYTKFFFYIMFTHSKFSEIIISYIFHLFATLIIKNKWLHILWNVNLVIYLCQLLTDVQWKRQLQ